MFNDSEVIKHFYITKSTKYMNKDEITNELLLEDLMLKRDFYLNTIKHLEFKIIDSDTKETRDLMKITLESLTSVEHEIRILLMIQ